MEFLLAVLTIILKLMFMVLPIIVSLLFLLYVYLTDVESNYYQRHGPGYWDYVFGSSSIFHFVVPRFVIIMFITAFWVFCLLVFETGGLPGLIKMLIVIGVIFSCIGVCAVFVWLCFYFANKRREKYLVHKKLSE